MSLNLIRTILENPGCAKGSSWSLLVSMADRADDDGKGVYASMRVMAENSGISERTAWDALKPLLEAKIVIDTGNIHDWGKGHFTRIYDIDQSAISALGTQFLQQSTKSAPRCGKRTTPVQNLQSRVQISHANQSYNQSPSPSAQEPVQEVSEEERKASSLRSDAGSCASESEQEALDPEVEAELQKQAECFAQEFVLTKAQMLKLKPDAYLILRFLYENWCDTRLTLKQALELHRYNSVHKARSPKLLFKADLAKMLTALRSGHPSGLIPSYQHCVEHGCPDCKRSRFEDVKPNPPRSATPLPFCTVCEKVRPIPGHTICGACESEPQAKGFDIEEVELEAAAKPRLTGSVLGTMKQMA